MQTRENPFEVFTIRAFAALQIELSRFRLSIQHPSSRNAAMSCERDATRIFSGAGSADVDSRYRFLACYRISAFRF